MIPCLQLSSTDKQIILQEEPLKMDVASAQQLRCRRSEGPGVSAGSP